MTERMRTAVPLIAGLLLVAAAVVVFFASARTPAEPPGALEPFVDSGAAREPERAAADTPPPDSAPPAVRADTPPRHPAPAGATAADSVRRDSARRDSIRRDSAARRGTPIGDPAALPRPPVTLPRPSPDSAGASR